MSLGNIIGSMLKRQMSGRSSSRLQTEAQNADQGGGIEQLLGSFHMRSNWSASAKIGA